MKLKLFLLGVASLFGGNLLAQADFPYQVLIELTVIEGLPGLHSFAHATYDGKWLLLGGRTDGIHAHQPWAAFPEDHNNTMVYVVDPLTNEVWSASVMDLPTTVREQMQATNMNFVQDDAMLYIMGGYAYAASVDDHISFPYFTAIDLPQLIEAVVNGTSITEAFVQIEDEMFALTGGYMGVVNDTFWMVGGHRFDGRYNPMDMPSFTQTYHSGYETFNVLWEGDSFSVENVESTSDPIHLRRRDFNLLPQIFPDGSEGFTISSGVFQINQDLPFLYPVDLFESGYEPVTNFNQYLSNYHSAHVCLHDADEIKMHNLFFGGISQYYFENGELIQDDNVPFVRTISRVTRYNDGSLQEFQLPVSMPELVGASAEFILNPVLPQTDHGVIHLDQIAGDTIQIGHIVGGLHSTALNPFIVNDVELTMANPTVYEISLVYDANVEVDQLNGEHDFSFEVYPNPAIDHCYIEFELPSAMTADYYLTDSSGKILSNGMLPNAEQGVNTYELPIRSESQQVLQVTCVFDGKYFITRSLVVK